MTRNLDQEDPAIDFPWYKSELRDEDVPLHTRHLLETYSGIEPARVREHVLEVRNRAFKVFPYPCIGTFLFLNLSLPSSPVYPEVVKRLRSGETLLDLGCCFGQELRQLVADGVPSEMLYGSDLQSQFIDLGYELFLDQETLRSHFIPANVLDAESRSPLDPLKGKINIVHAGSFFHLFQWDQQVQIGKLIVELLKPTPGSLLVGRQVGRTREGRWEGKGDGKGVFRHDEQSWRNLWKEIGDLTGTSWKVETWLERDTRAEDERLEKWTETEKEDGLWLLKFAVEID